MRVQILLLGQFRVSVGDTVIPADAWRRERAAALVKRLALLARHRLHREQAMELFWPDLDPDAAGANLRKAIHFARRALGEHDLLEVNGDIVALAPKAELVIDTEEFDAAAKAALSGQDGSECKRAADLYGGELLPDDRYVEWLEEPRQQLRERYARVLKAGKLWERLVELDPTDEEAQCALMQAALDAGNRAEAIRLFQRLRELLRIEFGVGPRAATIAIYERALAMSGAAPVSPVDGIRASLAWGLVHLQSGDFAKAESIARETRGLALGAELGREVGEASALLGLAAHMRGQWRDLFLTEFTEWIRAAPKFVSNMFDGHLCLAQFCLCGSSGLEETRSTAQELLSVAEREGSVAGRALALVCLGETELFSGRLDEAERLLDEAERLHVESWDGRRARARSRAAGGDRALAWSEVAGGPHCPASGACRPDELANAAPAHPSEGPCRADSIDPRKGRRSYPGGRSSAGGREQLPTLFDGISCRGRDSARRGGRAGTRRPAARRSRAPGWHVERRPVGRGPVGGAWRAAQGPRQRRASSGGFQRGGRTVRGAGAATR